MIDSVTTSPTEGSKTRIAILLTLMLIALGYLATCLYQIQVRDNLLYIGAQNETSIRRVRLPATRGRILDRNGVVLADNRPQYCAALYLDELRAAGRWSNTVNRIDRQIDRVAAILHRPREIDRNGIWQHLYRRRPIPLIAFRDLTEAELARLAEWPEPLPGVDIYVQQDRIYPFGDLACHIIGYVGKGNPNEKAPPQPLSAEEDDAVLFAEAENPDFDFYLPDLTGREGIEKAFDAELAGRGGGALLRIDAIGYRRELLEARNPQLGRDIVLTLDAGIQQAAERALDGHCGAAIVLNARNGDILALASAPRYDLSTFVPALSSSIWNELLSDPGRPLIHRAAAGVYPPGSIVKPIIALEALTEGIVSPYETVYCDGGYNIGNHRIRCASRWGHGDVNVRKALAASCNPYFMDIGLRLGYEPRIHDAYRQLGFGTAPQIGIPTGKSLLPDEAWKRKRFKDAWRPGDTAYASIGQGFLTVTPLQIAIYTLALANDGERVLPRLIRDPGTGVIDESRRVDGRMHWTANALQTVRDGMADAIGKPYGTGRRAAIPGVPIAGKTGTAEYREKGALKKHAWMIAMVPENNPEYVFTIVCEDSDSGGHSAATVLKTLLQSLYQTEKSPAAGEPSQNPDGVEPDSGEAPESETPDSEAVQETDSTPATDGDESEEDEAPDLSREAIANTAETFSKALQSRNAGEPDFFLPPEDAASAIPETSETP